MMILSSCYSESKMSYYQQTTTTTTAYAQDSPVYYDENKLSLSTEYYYQTQASQSPPQQYYYVEQPRNQGWSSTTSFLVGAATGYILNDLSYRGRWRGYQSYPYYYSQPWSAPAYYTPWMKNFGRSFHHGSGRVYHDISRGYYNGYGSIANGYQNGYGQIVQGLWR